MLRLFGILGADRQRTGARGALRWRSGAPCGARLHHTSTARHAPSCTRHCALIALLSSGARATPSRAQEPHAGTDAGFHARASAEQERALEADAIARPSASIARTHSRALSKETHVAGTPAQERTRDYVIQQMRAMGLETEVRTYDVVHAVSDERARVAHGTDARRS